jgi:hypothetical protein
MKKIISITAIMVIWALIVTSTIITASGGEQHWVYEDLAEFKQQIHPMYNLAIDKGTITSEEWNEVHTVVLNDLNLDNPIHIDHWAAMLKFIVGLPKNELDEHMKTYVYNFAQSGNITREDAVGGLIKLLTFKHISGSWSITDKGPNAAEDLLDYHSMSDKQQGLLLIAYRDQILDATVIDYFRPKDKLTNAEAVSMLNQVIIKYVNPNEKAAVKAKMTAWPVDHWSAKEMEYFYAAAPKGKC